MKRVVVPVVVVAIALVAVLAAYAGPHLSPWSTAQKIDEIAGNDVELEHAVTGRLPDRVARRSQPVHGLEPARQHGVVAPCEEPRHLGGTP
jgi:hypothetical protein